MSPILVRPVREQLEHDRVIRLLQAKYKRKFEVGINPGNDRGTPVGAPESPWYPDLVLQSTERGRKLLGVIEVETAESVNNLEAMSQWAAFSKLRAPFHLYIPASSIDTARRLCTALQISVAELWAYHAIGDQMRFTLIQRAPQAADGKPRASSPAPARPPAARGAAGTGSAARTRPARARTQQPAAARPARRPAANGTRSVAGVKSKSAGPRRPAKPAVRRSASGSSRAQKRR